MGDSREAMFPSILGYSIQSVSYNGGLLGLLMRNGSVRFPGVPGLDAQQALDAAGSPFAQKYADESDSEAKEQGVSSTPSFAVTPDGGDTKVVDADGLTDAIDDAISQAKG